MRWLRAITPVAFVATGGFDDGATGQQTPATPQPAPLIAVVTDRTALAEFDNQACRCVMQIDGTTANFSLGTAACRIADHDHDGRDDFALGAFDTANAMKLLYGKADPSARGAVVIVSSTGRELERIVAKSPSEGVGLELADLGDVDGDSVRDWALGVPEMSAGAAASALFGKSNLRIQGGTSGAEIGRLSGSAGFFALGVLPAREAGKRPELLTCFMTDKASRSECSARQLSAAAARTIPTSKGRIGQAVALDDLDGDGVSDFALSTSDPLDDRLGKVFFHSGSSGECFAQVAGEEKYARFGLVLCVTADIDGDGARELLVSEPSFGELLGRVLCISARSRRVLFDIPGWSDTLQFGINVVELGDLDGDGHHEVAISAGNHKEAPQYRGRVGVFTLDATGARERARLPGSAVFVLGDFDGDSRQEFATTDRNWPKPSENTGRVWVFSWKRE